MKYLYAGDIAERRRVSVSSARKWLAALERQHGSTVVGRVGKRLFTTEDALARVAPGFLRARTGTEALEERVRRLARALRTVEAEVEWLKGAVVRDGSAAVSRRRVEIDMPNRAVISIG